MRGGGRRRGETSRDKMNNEEMSPHHVTKHDSRHTCHVSRLSKHSHHRRNNLLFYAAPPVSKTYYLLGWLKSKKLLF